MSIAVRTARALPWSIACAALVAPANLPAHEGRHNPFQHQHDSFDHQVEWFELLFPDIQYERGDSDNRLVLALPVSIVVGSFGYCGWGWLPQVMLEPQYEATRGEWRLWGGLRSTFLVNEAWHVWVEGGGVVGTDGSGTGFSVGAGRVGRLSLVYRSTWTADEHRQMVGIDVHAFSLPLGAYAHGIASIKRWEHPPMWAGHRRGCYPAVVGPACDPMGCAPDDCGPRDDGCGGRMHCGDCRDIRPMHDIGCDIEPCSKGECGVRDDGCGRELDCGRCDGPLPR